MIAPDKILHLLAGFFITTLASILLPGMWVLVPTVVIGVGKELWDKFKEKEVFDWVDLYCTIIGGFVGWWIILVKQSMEIF